MSIYIIKHIIMKHIPPIHKNSSEKNIGLKFEAKIIKPLFKKKFNSSAIHIIPLSTTDSDRKVSLIDHSDHHNYEIKQLYNEKLGIIRDLISYTQKYDTSYSLRARFLKVTNLLKDLEGVIDDSAHRMSIESNFHQKLENSLREVHNVAMNPKPSKEFINEEDESLVKICTNISGIHCVALITCNRNMSSFDISVHGINSWTIQYFHVKVPVKSAVSSREQILKALILDKMYFCLHHNRIVLRYNPDTSDGEVLVVQLRGHTTETCVVIKEIEDRFELSIGKTFTTVLRSELKINSIREIRSSEKRYLMKNIIESKLSLIDSKVSWGLSLWEVMRNTTEQVTHSGVLNSKIAVNQGLLKEYENPIIKGTLKILDHLLNITLSIHTILGKMRILIEFQAYSVTLHQEYYENEFKFIKRLQKHDTCGLTLLKSLEFKHILQHLLFNPPDDFPSPLSS